MPESSQTTACLVPAPAIADKFEKHEPYSFLKVLRGRMPAATQQHKGAALDGRGRCAAPYPRALQTRRYNPEPCMGRLVGFQHDTVRNGILFFFPGSPAALGHRGNELHFSPSHAHVFLRFVKARSGDETRRRGVEQIHALAELGVLLGLDAADLLIDKHFQDFATTNTLKRPTRAIARRGGASTTAGASGTR